MSDMDGNTEREFGRILAKLEAMEGWQKKADERAACQARQLSEIQLQLASAKGAGKLLLGIAATGGGMIAWVIQKIVER